MHDEFNTEIAKLVTWMNTVGVPESGGAVWCLSRLPVAFRELELTYENRYAAEIITHEQAALIRLTEELGSAAADRVLELRGRFTTLNERFGLPALPSPEEPAARKMKPRKRAA
jgi:hypothetical protein